MPQNISVSIDEKLDRTQVETIATDFILASGYSLEDYNAMVTRDVANFLLAYLNSNLEQERFKTLVNSDTIPNIRWQVRYLKNIPRDQPQTRYFVWISPRGEIVGYRRNLPDTLTIESLTEDEATKKAEGFLKDRVKISLNNFVLKKSQQFREENRTDYTFSWEKSADFVEERFVELISSNRNMSAQGLIEILVKTIEDFSEDAPQHDDMTVVVIKIL